MRVLGVDVGIQTCGYVVCEVENLEVDLIKEGEVKPSPKHGFTRKLNHIFEKLSDEIESFKPEAIIVEKLYSHYRHPTTLGVLAQVRGVVALLAFQKKIGFFEYSSTRARKAFLGKGSGDSERVKKMAENMTGRRFKSAHTADAFSLISAFAHEQKARRILDSSST